MTNKTIFLNQTLDSNSEAFDAIGGLNGANTIYPFLTIYGNFDGASISIEYQAADGNWYPTGDGAITAPCAYFIEVSLNCSYRLALTSSGVATSISSTVYNVA